jgi:hypothetical protein
MQTFTQYLIETYNFQYHKSLNSEIWDGAEIKPAIRDKLLYIADQFYKYLNMPEFKVVDVILTGSLANYNYTNKSDLDTHLIVDKTSAFGKTSGIDIDDILFTKKQLWNNEHNINIKGFPVELYTQLADAKLTATGVYSLLNGVWVTQPKYEHLKIDNETVDIKTQYYARLIDLMVSSNSTDLLSIDKLKEKIKDMRTSGLKRGGEFSTENLVFKNLRNKNYIKKLHDYELHMYDDDMSLYQ